MVCGWSRLFPPTSCYLTHAPPPPEQNWGWSRKMAWALFFGKDEPLPAHGGVWGGEVRRFLWMKVQMMLRLCGYTSAGAGPVSLGLVVTMLALLLTCRGQCRGDMTNIHFHTCAHAQWPRSISEGSELHVSHLPVLCYKQTTDRPTDQPTDRPTDQPTNQPTLMRSIHCMNCTPDTTFLFL